MRIVVTGASGFLGSTLIKRLRNDAETEIIALSSSAAVAGELRDGVMYYHKDAVFGELASELLDGSVVVNCAYPRNSTGSAVADGLLYISRLFDACRACGARAVINISSQSVYDGKREAAAKESDALSLDTPYAVGKYSTELMIESVCASCNMAYTNVRMASLIGPAFNQRIVNRFVRRALDMEPISVNLNRQIFGFLDIEDAVSSIVGLIKLDAKNWKPVYNTGIGKGYTLKEMIETIQEVFAERGKDFPEVTYNDDDAVGNTSVDYNLLEADTGFRPEMDIKSSVIAILEQMEA